MKEKEENFNINELAGGAIQEAISFALKDVFENIKDPNTDAEKARKLTITMELKPDESRQIIKTKISCKTNLVPVNSIITQLFLDKDGDKVVAKELLKHDPNQVDFSELETENDKIIKMKEAN